MYFEHFTDKNVYYLLFLILIVLMKQKTSRLTGVIFTSGKYAAKKFEKFQFLSKLDTALSLFGTFSLKEKSPTITVGSFF